jgi:molybdopterin-containing oxidoreductase family membrane subunit
MNELGPQPSRAKALRKVGDDVLGTMGPPGRLYFASLAFVLGVLGIGGYAWWYQMAVGLGVAGYSPPIMWALYITNFVFWVGIAHSGTLISAILYLLRARWRMSVARAAEAMTVFAVMTAGLFPIIHLGRPWLFFWLLPYPNQRELWINFRSPLVWDVFAVTTYFTVSALFLFLGLLPDLAIVRDRASGLRRRLYGLLALGWRGTSTEWRHYTAVYGFFAALATPLVVSVHSVVSWDFAMAIAPGWHSTIFAPYFVAGAILSGLAMVLTILIPLRRLYRLEEYVTLDHFESLAKLIITTSLIVSYSYATESFLAWYRGSELERATMLDRARGAYAPFFWTMVGCNALVPLSLFARRVRRSIPALFVISLLVNVGMYLERFVIIVSSLAHGADPTTWRGVYEPTWVEYSITAGSFAWFALWFLLFVKLFPALPVSELRELALLRLDEEGAHG